MRSSPRAQVPSKSFRSESGARRSGVSCFKHVFAHCRAAASAFCALKRVCVKITASTSHLRKISTIRPIASCKQLQYPSRIPTWPCPGLYHLAELPLPPTCLNCNHSTGTMSTTR